MSQSQYFYGSSLRQARLFQNLTQAEVADRLGFTRQFINRWEAGAATPNDEQIESLSRLLNVQKSYFGKVDPNRLEEHQFHFRKLRTTKVRTKDHIMALGNLCRKLTEVLDEKLDLPTPNFPSFDCYSADDIERAAEACRRYWKLGLGPIDNMTRVLESAGAIITDFAGESSEVDALSIIASRPILVRNAAKESPGRLRFDLAHELGHIVMHDGRITGDKQSENEANHFAGAFLLPRSTFVNVFPVMNRISWKKVVEIKKIFKVSKAAILYRAKQLKCITDQQYKNAVIRLRKHEGRTESDDYLIQPIEQPELIHKALSLLNDHLGIGLHTIENMLDLGHGTLNKVLGERYSHTSIETLASNSNVVPLFK